MSAGDPEGKIPMDSFELLDELAFEQEAVEDVDEDLSRDDLASLGADCSRGSNFKGIAAWAEGAVPTSGGVVGEGCQWM